MLIVYFGNDGVKMRRAATTLVGEYQEQHFLRNDLDGNNWEVGAIPLAIGNTSLFAEKQLYLLDSTAMNKTEGQDFLKEVETNLDGMHTSDNIFLWLTSNLSAASKKSLASLSITTTEFKKTENKQPDVFAIARALARKDKKNLWLCFCATKDQGVAAEETIGILWWQLKTLQLAAHTKTAEEAGMKDYSYRQAKQALVNFKAGEIAELAAGLLAVYHEGHSGKKDIDLALEQWLLGV